jgi:pSer/pThr/pTyr-binding forkhead associated (FHA) protein
VIENEWTAAQTIQLSEGENIIGRSSNSNSPTKRNVITRDEVMSRNHFKITVEKNEEKYYFALKDIGSKNGTKLNDKSLGGNEVLVQVNNTITAGETFFKLG